VLSPTFVVLETNLLLGMIYVLLSALSMITNQLGKKQMNQKTDNRSKSNSSLVTIMKDIFDRKNEIRTFAIKNLFLKNFSNSINIEEKNYFQLNKVQFTVQFCAWVCAVLANVIQMGIGLLMVVNHFGGVEIGTIVTLTLTADHVLGGVREIVGYQTQI